MGLDTGVIYSGGVSLRARVLSGDYFLCLCCLSIH